MNIFKKLWKILYPEKSVEDPILPGQSWEYFPKDNGPWPPQKGYNAAIILDYAKGWVRYDLGRPYRDQRMKENTFRSIYKLRIQ